MQNENGDVNTSIDEIDNASVDTTGNEYDGTHGDADNGDEEELNAENFKKYKDLSNNYKIRAEKAEAKLKGEKKPEGQKPKPQTASKDDITMSDMYALIKHDVPEEDFKQVGLFAKTTGISISEALKDPTLNAILARNKEHRETARATNIGQRRAGNQRVTDKQLLEDFNKGIFPENEEDIERLAKARIASQKNRR